MFLHEHNFVIATKIIKDMPAVGQKSPRENLIN